jgi:hypothetical protein
VDILEEYKKLAEKRRQDLEQTGQDASGMYVLRCMKVVSDLQTIYKYLHDLIEQLNFVQPKIETTIKVDDLGELENLKQSDYQLITESSSNRELVCINFSLNNESKLELEIPNTLESKEQLEALSAQGVLVNYTSKSPLKVSIQGHIPVSIEFQSDFEESSIDVSISNFSRLASEDYTLNTDEISEELLNDLGNYILRNNINFLNTLVEDSHSISIIEANANNNNEGHPRTEEMDISRLRSLFNRESRLYLTYHNKIKDLGSRTHGIILGRAKDCDLMVTSDLASRHHAQIVYRKGKFVLIDQSTNGTFVKAQGGKEVYVQQEEAPLVGSGFISLGKAVTVDNEHLIYFSCQ